MAAVAAAGDLPEKQRSVEIRHLLVAQAKGDLAAIDLGLAQHTPLLAQVLSLALEIGEDVEVVFDQRLEQPWAPPATVEDMVMRRSPRS